MTDEAHEWVAEGVGGRVICDTCGIDRGSSMCLGCPVAWRTIDGNTEYFKEPVHGSGLTEEM